MNGVAARSASGAESTSRKFCGHCGEPSDGGGLPPSDGHRRCSELLVLEPPRYCPHCRRRMKVQVTPLGWQAECSRHGALIPCDRAGSAGKGALVVCSD